MVMGTRILGSSTPKKSQNEPNFYLLLLYCSYHMEDLRSSKKILSILFGRSINELTDDTEILTMDF